MSTSWDVRHPEKVKSYKKKWQDAHKSSHAARAKASKIRLWALHPERVKLQRYKHAAKHKGVEFSLPDLLALDLITDNCYYCGANPDPVNGIDRVDNSKGYLEDNVVTACKLCNRGKMNLTKDAFEAWAISVAKRAEVVWSK